MNAICRWLCLIVLSCSALRAAEAEAAPASPAARVEYLPGVALSQGITEITGVAISPLLGVSSVGAWRYWNTPAAGRDALPWYAQPWAWGTGLGLLTLCFLKDSLGTAVPGLLKKPFDMVELFENKLSALVASGAFVPLIATEMAKHLQAQRALEVPNAMIGMTSGMGNSVGFIDLTWFMVPAAVISFLLVWVCSHAINVLIILSPFSTLDAALKLARASLLASVGIIYVIAPGLAAVFCLILIALAAWCAPSALRLAIFGARFASDILIPGRSRSRATPQQPHAFTLGRSAGLPPRTGGKLILLADGSTAFRYRRWCILDERTVPLPEGQRHVEKGLLSPSLIHSAGGNETKMLLFLPRYKGHEESLARHLQLHGVREHRLTRGWNAIKSWFGKTKAQVVG
jgi:hypothetical protein